MRTAILLALLTLAGSAVAQETRTRADYSRDTLLRLFQAAAEDYDQPIRYDRGAVEFRALGTTWRFNYLPMRPLSGSWLTTAGREWPDPFTLTGTQIATSPRAWRTQRQINSELRRIEATERAKVRVTVGGGSR
jgi:hypothetical protein